MANDTPGGGDCSRAVEYRDEKYPQPFLCALLIFFSIKGKCFIDNVKFTGLKFPANAEEDTGLGTQH